MENKYQDVYFGARIAMRFFGPSASPDRIISYAVAMHGVPADEHPCKYVVGRHVFRHPCTDI